MTIERFEIKNRHGLRIVGSIDTEKNSSRLVFIAHGQAGSMNQKHINTFANVFLRHGYRVVRFDATHAGGKSEGSLIDVTHDTYISDLEDIIKWSRTQQWFCKPFALCGHSMGAHSTIWYAEHHPNQISALAAMAPVINYELYVNTFAEDELQSYKSNGYIEWKSYSRPGEINKIGWGVVESLRKYDILTNALKLTMPILNVTGEFDKPCPIAHQNIFMNSAGSADKSFVVVPNANHNYRNFNTDEYGVEFEQVESELNDWLGSIS